jgi:hypothetical protein
MPKIGDTFMFHGVQFVWKKCTNSNCKSKDRMFECPTSARRHKCRNCRLGNMTLQDAMVKRKK